MAETKFSVAEEFKMLFQPLSLEARTELEKKLLQDKAEQTVSVWQSTLLETPDKYEIYQKRNIPFVTKEIAFTDALEAGAYICGSELNRKDLTVEMKTFLIGRLFLYRQEIEARDFISRNPNAVSFRRHGNRPKGVYETASEIGVELNLAAGTVLKYGRYASAVESINVLNPEIAKAILSHRIRISHEDLQELVSDENRLNIFRKLSQEILRSKVNYYDFKKRMEEEARRQIVLREKRIQQPPRPSIHEMPKYDPDADILNLIYTIPSWISSIDRAANNTDFNSITMKSSWKLKEQIDLLRGALERIEAALMGGV